MPIARAVAGVTGPDPRQAATSFAFGDRHWRRSFLAAAAVTRPPNSGTGLRTAYLALVLSRDPRPGEIAGLYPETYLFYKLHGGSRLSSLLFVLLWTGPPTLRALQAGAGFT